MYRNQKEHTEDISAETTRGSYTCRPLFLGLAGFWYFLYWWEVLLYREPGLPLQDTQNTTLYSPSLNDHYRLLRDLGERKGKDVCIFEVTVSHVVLYCSFYFILSCSPVFACFVAPNPRFWLYPFKLVVFGNWRTIICSLRDIPFAVPLDQSNLSVHESRSCCFRSP